MAASDYNPIAERRLSVVGDPSRTVTVTFGQASQSQSGEWQCPFQIAGLDVSAESPDQLGYGIDSLSALLNALEGARAVLDASGLVFTWEGGEAGDTGIPKMIPGGFGRVFAQKVEEYIEWQAGVFATAAKAYAEKKRH